MLAHGTFAAMGAISAGTMIIAAGVVVAAGKNLHALPAEAAAAA
ncbi:MAG TPA: hypothetical protein VMH80_17035 [Bryobacteraceae bacterium]|nr:hypothetical protein [Bryobacteraceae bacterium]